MFIILLFRLFLSAKVSKWKNNMALVLFLKKKQILIILEVKHKTIRHKC